MPVLEQRPLKKVEIARAMGWSKSYLSQERFKGMPAFYAIEDFRAWYQATSQRGGPDGTVVFAGEQSGGGAKNAGPVCIDWDRYANTAEDPLEETIKRCERVADLAYGLLDSAIRSGDIGAAYGSLKNWSEALKQTAAVKEDYLELQKNERKVLPLDDVMNVVGEVFRAFRHQLERQNKRTAARINPEDPGKALEMLDEAANEIFRAMSSSEERIRESLDGEYAEKASAGG